MGTQKEEEEEEGSTERESSPDVLAEHSEASLSSPEDSDLEAGEENPSPKSEGLLGTLVLPKGGGSNEPFPKPPFQKQIMTLNRSKVEEAHFNNFADLIEVVVHLLLPACSTCALQALVDTGASDNFLSTSLQQEFGIQIP